MPGPMFLLGVSVQGGLLQGSLSGVSVRSLCRGGVSVKRISVQRDLCPGGLCPGGPLDRDLLYGEERAVHILLECFLVHCCFPIDESVI